MTYTAGAPWWPHHMTDSPSNPGGPDHHHLDQYIAHGIYWRLGTGLYFMFLFVFISFLNEKCVIISLKFPFAIPSFYGNYELYV